MMDFVYKEESIYCYKEEEEFLLDVDNNAFVVLQDSFGPNRQLKPDLSALKMVKSPNSKYHLNP